MAVVRNLIARAGIDLTNFERGMKKMENQLKRTSKKVGEIGKKMSLAFTVPLLTVATIGVKTASDLEEVQNVVNESFKGSTKRVDEWAKTTLKSYGLSELSAKKYASTIRAMVGSMGLAANEADNMSLRIAELAGDMASFYNIATDEAFTKLRSGLSGETEPLKQLGINLNVANLEAYALSKGIKTAYTELSEAEKVTLRYQYILHATKIAQGDFARNTNSLSNQARLAKEQFLQTSSSLMQNLLPVLTALLEKVNKIFMWFNNLNEGTKKFITTILMLVATIGPLLILYAKWLKLKAFIVGIYKTMTIAQIVATQATNYETAASIANTTATQMGTIAMLKKIVVTKAHTLAIKAHLLVTKLLTAATWLLNAAFIATPIGWIVLAIGGLIAIIVTLANKLGGFANLWNVVWSGIKNGFKATLNFIISGINAVMNGIKWLVNGAISIVNKLIKGLNKIPFVNIPLIPEISKDAMQIPKLAKGGIAYGNTIANVGEYANARTNPEVIAPLDKLQSLLNLDGGRNQVIIVELDGKPIAKSVLRNAGGLIRLKNG